MSGSKKSPDFLAPTNRSAVVDKTKMEEVIKLPAIHQRVKPGPARLPQVSLSKSASAPSEITGNKATLCNPKLAYNTIYA